MCLFLRLLQSEKYPVVSHTTEWENEIVTPFSLNGLPEKDWSRIEQKFSRLWCWRVRLLLLVRLINCVILLALRLNLCLWRILLIGNEQCVHMRES